MIFLVLINKNINKNIKAFPTAMFLFLRIFYFIMFFSFIFFVCCYRVAMHHILPPSGIRILWGHAHCTTLTPAEGRDAQPWHGLRGREHNVPKKIGAVMSFPHPILKNYCLLILSLWFLFFIEVLISPLKNLPKNENQSPCSFFAVKFESFH